MAGPIRDKEEKKGFFARFKGGEKKPKKEKKPKEKTPKAPKEGKKNMFGKEKMKPRAEYQAEIDALKAELHDTQIRYEELQRWAKNPPVRAN